MTKTVSIPLDAPALARGIGFFETLLVVRGEPVLLREHYERMAAGTRSIGLPSPGWAAFERIARREARRHAKLAEASLRVSWLAIGHDIDAIRSWRLYALAGPVPDATLLRRRRGRVIILRNQIARTSPALKTVSYIPSVLGLREAHRQRADEALFTDSEGRILEGTTSNVFAVNREEIVTPPVAAGLLPGVMRAWVERVAPEAGFRVTERVLQSSELLEGAFLTGSLTTIAPIRFVDGQRCGNCADVVSKLRRRWALEIRRTLDHKEP